MATYKISSFYKGSFPVVITVDGEEFVSNELGEIVDPPVKVARLLEGMPEWGRIEGDHPYGPHEVVTGVLKTQVLN